MRRFTYTCFLAIVVALPGSPTARAQTAPPTTRADRFSTTVDFSQQPQQNLAQTLNLTADQQRLLQQWTQRLDPTVQAGGPGPLNAPTLNSDALLFLLQRADATTLRDIVPLLDQTQLARLQQLRLQFQGLAAFNNADLQRRLNLTPDQLRDLQLLAGQFNTQIGQFGAIDPLHRDGSVQRWHNFQRQTAERLNTILNQEQRRTFGQLTGTPLQLAQPMNRAAPTQLPPTQAAPPQLPPTQGGTAPLPRR